MCPEPFAGIFATVDGIYKPCCVSNFDYGVNVSTHTITEAMNSPRAKQLRDAFNEQNHEFLNKACSACKRQEHSGQKSYRENIASQYGKKYNPATLENAKNNPGEHFHSIEVVSKNGNYCNLKCTMCTGFLSSSLAKEAGKLNEEDGALVKGNYGSYKYVVPHKDGFEDNFFELLKNTEELKFTGGEPLAGKWTYRLLQYSIDSGVSKNLNLQFNTNATLISPVEHKSIFDMIPFFKKVQMNVSVDSWGERNNYIRYPSKFDIVLNNAIKFSEYENCDVTFTATISALSIPGLEELLYRSSLYNFKPAVVTNYVTEDHGSGMGINSIPDDIKEEYIERLYNVDVPFCLYINSLRIIDLAINPLSESQTLNASINSKNSAMSLERN